MNPKAYFSTLLYPSSKPIWKMNPAILMPIEILVADADYQLYFYRNVIYIGLHFGILMKLPALDSEEEILSMKLLVVSPNLPSPTWGAGTRNYYLLKTLAREHTVSLLALVDNYEIEEHYLSILKDFVHTIQIAVQPAPISKRLQQLMYIVCGKSYALGINSYLQRELDMLLLEKHYDAVIYESALVAGNRLPEGVKCIVDQHNIEYELLWRTYQRETNWLRKWYNRRESQLLRPIEIERCGKADMVVTTSERDSLLLKNILPRSVVEVVPNGVDLEVFQCDSREEVCNQIIFTGAMNYYPNIDAVNFFAQRCWPLIQAQIPGATLLIVGSHPLPEVRRLAELPGVTVTGFVPDVRPYLAASPVAIAPLQIGSGTRFKILEALAMQKAVISTSVGCEGLSVVPGKHLLVADQPEAFAQAVITLLNNPEMRAALGTAGRALVEAEYSWERCGARFLRALETNLKEREQVY
jgi:sugar transferase (PEP-CTERM/EpsH1 system associated)